MRNLLYSALFLTVVTLIFAIGCSPLEVEREDTKLPGTLVFAGGPTSADSDIWTTPLKDTDGAGFTQLVFQPNSNQYWPRWSPDGAKILYVSSQVEVGTNLPVDVLYTMNADGGNRLRIFTSPDGEQDIRNLSWNPDGTQVAFDYQQDIYTIDADGTNLSNITNTPNDVADSGVEWERKPDWSPDGTKILYLTVAITPDPYGDIMVVDLGSGAKTSLARSQLNSSFDAARWSPDGTEVAYFIGTGDDAPLFLMDADGNNSRRLTEAGDITSFCWSPNGDYLAYAVEYWENHTTHTDLRVLNIESGNISVFLAANRWYFTDMDWKE